MNRQISLTLLLLIFTAVLCLGILGMGGMVLVIPEQAEQVFGTASSGLAPLQRMLLSARLLMHADELTQPRDPAGFERPFEAPLGESTHSIIDRLQMEGFITNASALRDYLVYAGLDTTIQAGKYSLSPSMTPIEIANALQDATPAEVVFNILPGWRMEEIADALPTSGLEITPQAFLESASNPTPESLLYQQLPPNATLEGYLFPDSYRLVREIPANELVATMLQDFILKVDQELTDGFQRQGLSLHQAVTLASILQREAVVEDEMPMIASVFYNRLNAGMKLDSDPTVQYVLGFDATKGTWWTNPLSLDHLQTDSPYNTYLYPGLPPGPIANPGLNALRAVAFPAQSPYYYFRAACDGSGRHTFATTFEEHQNNACP